MTDSPSTTPTSDAGAPAPEGPPNPPREDDPAAPASPTYHRELSGSVPNVHEAMAHAMAQVRAVGKWGTNKEQGYSFRSIDDFMTALNPAMAAAGVHIAPTVLQRITDESHTTSGNKVFRWVDVEMRFTFYGPAGDSFDVITWGEARDAADKATNKAMTGAFKYAIMQAFMVPTQDLQDADAHDPQVEAQAQQPPPRPPDPVEVERQRRMTLTNADPATVDAIRTEVLAVCDEVPPGDARTLGLRAVYSKASQEEALGCMVDLPEAWRRGNAVRVRLWELITGARTIAIPSGESPDTDESESAEDGPVEAQEWEQGGVAPADTQEAPSAPQTTAQRAEAHATQMAERTNSRTEEDPWATR